MTSRTPANYLAVDLGASSGRVLIAEFDGRRVELAELHRFPNGPIQRFDHLHWDVDALMAQIQTGLTEAPQRGIRLDGVGVDTWGVDYGLLSANGELLDLPFHYRDGRTAGMMERAFARVPREEIFARTGIQFMPLNTVYQLLADRQAGDGRLERAALLLFMPDLINQRLAGVKRTDVSIASTSQLFDTGARAWATDLLARLELPPRLFPQACECATRIGSLRGEIAAATGCGSVPVFCPAGHDTACAVAAIPAEADDWAYVSAGTWSVVGLEAEAPLRTPQALEAGVTNELGAAGTVRLLRNVTGLWLVQECQRVWRAEGRDLDFDELAHRAQSAAHGLCFIDPDDPRYAQFGDMPQRIREFCRRTGQEEPADEAQIVRCVLESLALKIRWVLDRLARLTQRRPRVVHVVGGGAANKLLCQFIADATALPVRAGPVEATAMGNALLQAMADGRLGSLEELRAVVRRSVHVRCFEPSAGEQWMACYARFEKLVST